MKFKYVEEKLLKSGSIQFDVLENQEKKNQSRIKNREKMINKTKKSVHPGAKIYCSWTIILKDLSQLIDAFFWCDSSAKNFPRPRIFCG